MMLRRRVITSSLTIALPVALVLAFAVDRWRAHDLAIALERVVRSQINEQVRERCEGDPGWFFTGPLLGRPKRGDTVDPNPEALAPRPRYTEQAFELFAYDEDFLGSSTAAPRFPLEFRRSLLATPDARMGSWASAIGTGVQIALPTGWPSSPCQYFLGRMQPSPRLWPQRIASVIGFFIVAFGVAVLAAEQTVSRVLKLARAARASVGSGYTTIAPDTLKDELSSIMFVFNDTATELHERQVRISDQDVALKQFVRSAADDVAQPLAALEFALGEVETGVVTGSHADARLREALLQAHDLGAQMANLTAAARLRMSSDAADLTRIDLSVLVTRVVARHQAFAHATNVTLTSAVNDSPTMSGDEMLIERAVANVVDNAIRYNTPGGRVTVELAKVGEDRFRLVVVNSGLGMSDEELKSIATPRRFRGDEGRNRRPGWRGLGLAVTQEAADRFGITIVIRRSAERGLEVEFSGAA
jgi:signal transduction histidine kinase